MDKKLINSIAEEVIRQISAQEAGESAADGTLVLLVSHLAGQRAALDSLRKKIKGKIVIAPIGVSFDCMAPDFAVNRNMDGKLLVEAAAASKNIVLLSPKISHIVNISEGIETNLTEEIMIRSILWGKNVTVLLDYVRPRFKSNTFYERIGDALDALAGMGVEVMSYTFGKQEKEDALSLVTERDVEEASAKGKSRIRCLRGAIVTPAARDRALALKIKIDG